MGFTFFKTIPNPLFWIFWVGLTGFSGLTQPMYTPSQAISAISYSMRDSLAHYSQPGLDIWGVDIKGG